MGAILSKVVESWRIDKGGLLENESESKIGREQIM